MVTHWLVHNLYEDELHLNSFFIRLNFSLDTALWKAFSYQDFMENIFLSGFYEKYFLVWILWKAFSYQDFMESLFLSGFYGKHFLIRILWKALFQTLFLCWKAKFLDFGLHKILLYLDTVLGKELPRENWLARFI